MATERERRTNYHTLLTLCLEEDGTTYATDLADGLEFFSDGTAMGQTDGSSTDSFSFDLVHRSDAVGACAGIAESRSGLPQVDPEVVHDRMLDTHACLAAQGYDLPPLPPENDLVPELRDKLTQYYGNVGVEHPTEPWDPGEPLVTPYRLLADAYPEMGGEEWYRLKETCVEFGVSYTVAFVTEGGR